ncbi:type I polyketide synthase [Actinomadura harenae]|uniref:Acyltransferase domain-containing protein n=1 Tax=Actinomadura harenae TaxID=2483351 RepID=A0A3M2M0S7_9ACTN|nr:type I polyketide synthase [Actinomadura harenae]RMI43187.1 acyltransferase domain-containing protein [Actinomadura harenae]
MAVDTATTDTTTADATAEPVAIVGMACRLPGGISTPERFWTALTDGLDAITDIPPDRWAPYAAAGGENAALLRGATSRGGFLADPGEFDAAFFGITPREAELIDPQQRLVLETAWEALEHAGIAPHTLGGPAGGGTAVYMGVGSDDYGRQMLEDLPGIEAWSGIGAACCAVANRLSYFLDAGGPSHTVDAACASSLVAVHLGCESLGRGESDLVLAGGVNVIAAPGLTIALDAAQALSPRGSSRPFDADADGYVRGEGAGVLVLKRLADARRDGDRVLAVIRGSAVRHGGRTNGIMAPSGTAQEAVARQALRRAGIAPDTVGYVEAHGTATRAGDPVEVAALSAVFGAGRPGGEPCLIGSVKGNIGHLEAAAGIAGTLKAVLAIGQGAIPGQVGFTRPNPSIPWEGSGLQVVTGNRPWPATAHPRRAGISSFGFGGTVCHIVLEEPPPEPAVPEGPAEPGAPAVYPLSATSEETLREYAGLLADHLDDDPAVRPADLGRTLWHGRTHQPFRAAVVADGPAGLRYGLRMIAADQPAPGVLVAHAPPGAPSAPVWVFSGHGSQWEGMGRELLGTRPEFARVVDEIDPVFRAEIGWSPREKLENGPVEGVDQIQAMIFVVQVGLAAVLRELGVRPAAVIGHSVGEVAAAVTAGVFGLPDGARLICRRSTLLRRVAGAGAMVMVRQSFEAAAETVEGLAAEAVIESSPDSTVVAGTPDAISAVRAICRERGVMAHPISSDVAFHTAQMDPLVPDLAAGLAGLLPARPAVPLYTTALDDPRSPVVRDGAYWAGNLRNPVRLATAVAAAAEDGHRLFLEVSPHPVVTHSVNETLHHLGLEHSFAAGSLRRNQPERATLLAAIGALHCHGGAVDPARTAPDGRTCSLPRSPWRHQRYWRRPARTAHGAPVPPDPASSSLLSTSVTTADPALPRYWRTWLDHATRPYPGEHLIQGVEVVPAAILLNTLFAAAGRAGLGAVTFHSPLVAGEPREVQVIERGGALRLASRDASAQDAPWQTHVTATALPGEPAPDAVDLDGLRARSTDPLPADLPMARLRASGIAGAGLRWTTRALSAGEGRLLAEVEVEDDGTPRWPRIWDAATTIGPVVLGDDTALRLLAAADRVVAAADPPSRVVVLLERKGDDELDAMISDEEGRVLGTAGGLRFGRPEGDPATTSRTLLHGLEWLPAEREAPQHDPRRLVLIGGGPLAARIAAQARADGVPCVRAPAPAGDDDTPDWDTESGLTDLDERDVVLVVGDPHADGDDVGDRAVTAAWTLTRAVQALARPGRRSLPRLWCVTAGARHGRGPAQAPLWGLGQIVAGEHPELWGGIADLTPSDLDASVTSLLAELKSRGDADILALDGGQVRAARLTPQAAGGDGEALAVRPDGTYLITGGMGVLGLQVAEWLASLGARRLLLLGRTPLPPRSRWDGETDPGLRHRIAAIRRLEGLGVTVRALPVDIADAGAVTRALDPDRLGLPPIRGVVHAAGTLDDRLLDDLDRESLRAVFRAKAEGALVLDRLFPPGSLDFLVLFSSIGQHLGLPGQGGYAAANAFLDHLAARRRATGHDDTTSLSWTSWSGMGMAVNAVVDHELRRHGIGRITAEQAFQAWTEASRHHGRGHVCVFPVTEPDDPARVRPILRELRRAAPPAAAPDTGDADRFAAMSPGELHEHLVEEVAGLVSREVRIPVADLDPSSPLTALGLDSIMTTAIRHSLEKRFRTDLPATLLWNHPTVSDLAGHLADRFTADPTPR